MICITTNCNNQVDNPFEDEFCSICDYENWKSDKEDREDEFYGMPFHSDNWEDWE